MSAKSSANVSTICWNAILRTLIVPLLAWGVAVFTITRAGQPGVVCMTPMAWLLALWSGRQYVRLSDGQSGLLGPALVGAVLGLGLGPVFALVSAQAMPVDPSEVGKSQALTAIMIVGGVVVCTALSTFIARAALRRYARAQ